MAETYHEILEAEVSVGGLLDAHLSDNLYEQALAGLDMPFVLWLDQLNPTHTSIPGAADHTWTLRTPDEPRQLRTILEAWVDSGTGILATKLIGSLGSHTVTSVTDTTANKEHEHVHDLTVWTSVVNPNEDATLEMRIYGTAGANHVRMVDGPVCAWEQDGATRP